MNLKTLRAVQFIFALFAPLVTAQVNAETVSNGPYYATPSWDQTLPSNVRFIVLSNFGNAAVLDRETGLVWEKAPQTATATWELARFLCASKGVGGRQGWRLPTFVELTSLIDPSVGSPGPLLPPGHPFVNVESANYWSATTNALDPTSAWRVGFEFGGAGIAGKIFGNHVWCVRGATQSDQY